MESIQQSSMWRHLYLHPFGRLGEHERGEVVELRVVRIQRLERRRGRRERRGHLRSFSLRVLPRRSGVAHGRGILLLTTNTIHD